MNRRDTFLAIVGLAVAPLAAAKSDKMPCNLRVYLTQCQYCIYDLRDKEWVTLERQCWGGDTFKWKQVHPMNLQEGELVLAREARLIHKITRAPFFDQGTHCIVADTWCF